MLLIVTLAMLLHAVCVRVDDEYALVASSRSAWLSYNHAWNVSVATS